MSIMCSKEQFNDLVSWTSSLNWQVNRDILRKQCYEIILAWHFENNMSVPVVLQNANTYHLVDYVFTINHTTTPFGAYKFNN